MNEVNARGVEVYGGYHGEFRKVHKAGWEKVCISGKPQVFPSEEAAEIAPCGALPAHLCGDIVRSGEKASNARSRAEELFGVIIRRGKKIPVERR